MGLSLLAQAPDTLEGIQFFDTTIPARQLLKPLRSRVNSPLDLMLLEHDLHTLQEFYRAEGFLDAAVDHEVVRGSRPGWAILKIRVREGVRARIDQVEFSGNRAFSGPELRARAKIRSGEWLKETLLIQAQSRLEELYKNNGYPWIEIERRLDRKGDEADLHFQIREGPLSYLVRIKVEGNLRVASRVVVGIAGIGFGERFSSSRLRRAQARLYASQLFSRVGYRLEGPPSEMVPSRLTLIWEVEELPPRIIGGGVGYETPDRLLLSIEWQHLNLLNQGQTFSINADFTPNLYKEYRLNLDARYLIPYYWGVPVDFTLHPFYYQEEEQEIHKQRWGVEWEMGRELSPDLRLVGVVRYKRVAISPRELLPNPEGLTNSLILNLLWDYRDDFFNPNHGGYHSLSLERAGGFLRGDNDLRRAVVDLRCFWSVLASRVRVGWVVPYGRTSEIPCYEAFELGGRNSLRGYPERSLGPGSLDAQRFGDFLLGLNLELRSPYYRRLSGVLFCDLGSLSNGPADLFRNEYGYSGGLGLRIDSPIGPLRVDYGKRLKDPGPGDWGVIYFGLLQTF